MVLLALLLSCGKSEDPLSKRSLTHRATEYEGRLAHEWMMLGHQMIRENYLHGPHAARMFGYLGLTAWESVCNGLYNGKSMAGQINDYPEATYIDHNIVYDWGTVLCAAMQTVFPVLVENINNAQLSQVKLLAARQEDDRIKKGLSEQVRQDSRALGQRIGLAIADRIRTDGREVIRNTVRDSTHDWYWDQHTLGQIPVEPMWGTIRTFVTDNAQFCEPRPPYPYSTHPESDFFLQATEIYQHDRGDAHKAVAYHWEDGPGRTSSPAGHWMSIAQQLLERENGNLAESAKTYCLLGLALADAYSVCWFSKYKYFMLRPVTYIRERIDANWTPLLHTPADPEYSAAAATMGGVAPLILIHLFGDTGFVDTYQLGSAIHTPESVPVILPERIFSSLTQSGAEARQSGIVGGVHFRRACEEGYASGQCVANAVLSRVDFGF